MIDNISECGAEEEAISGLALTLISGLGNKSIRQLVAYAGSAAQVFRLDQKGLQKIPSVGNVLSKMIKEGHRKKIEAEKIYKNCLEKEIDLLFFTQKNYPDRLRHFADGPAILFAKGAYHRVFERSIGIVGTRNATDFGRKMTHQLIEAWQPYEPLIISGLAYGIDVCAHRSALDLGLPTWAVLGNGLDSVYPAVHHNIAKKICQEGALFSEVLPGSKPDRQNFPMRNRIVAMLCDAVVVVEAAARGGALITANQAFDYNKEVFAVPGKPGEMYSEGCNDLIARLKASILHRADLLPTGLNWDLEENGKPKQKILFPEYTKEEEPIINAIQKQGKIPLESLCEYLNEPPHILLNKLMQMELKGLIKRMPGQQFCLM